MRIHSVHRIQAGNQADREVPYGPCVVVMFQSEWQEFAGAGTFWQWQINSAEGVAREVLPGLPRAFVPRQVFGKTESCSRC